MFVLKNKMNNKLIYLIMFSLLFLPMVSAADWFQFDNYKSFNKDVGDYGKITIFDKNLFGEDNPLQEVLLVTNSEECYNNNCKATKQIIMHEQGILINEVKFFDLIENEEIILKNYSFYIINGEKRISYELGEEVEAGTYDIEFKGKIKPFQSIDWQILIGNKFWTEEWAEWTSTLNTGLIGYYAMEEGVGVEINNSLDETKFHGDLINTPSWTTGIIGGGLDFENATEEYANITSPFPLGNNFTISLWIKPESLRRGSERVFSQSAGGLIFAQFRNESGDFLLDFFTGATLSYDISKREQFVGLWKHLVFQQNGTHSSIWVNRTLKKIRLSSTNFSADGSAFYLASSENAISWFDGDMDELAIWKRALSPSEISQLFNDGTGITFTPATATTLNSPPDNGNSITVPMPFKTTITPMLDGNVTNATIRIYDSEGNLFNETSKILTGNIANSTNFSISNLNINAYTWNVLGCSNTSTESSCEYAENNFTLDYGIKVLSQSFNTASLSGNIETFAINLQLLNSSFSIGSANLIYNNTVFPSGSISSSGAFFNISRTIDVPITSSLINNSFFWNIILNNGFVFNTSENNQTVNSLRIGNCSAFGTLLLNYTMFDEINQTLILDTKNPLLNIDIQLFALDYTTLITQLSINSTTNHTQICLKNPLNTSQYFMDVTNQYRAGNNYVSKFNHIQKKLITEDTIPVDVPLFNLLNVNATEFKITFKDSNFIRKPNTLIIIARKYIDEGVFKTVEVGKTDSLGETIVNLQLSTVIYSITFTFGGEILAVLDNILAQCQNPLLQECTITENAFSSNVNPEDFTFINGINLLETFSQSNRKLTTSFIAESGTSTVVQNVTKFDRFGNDTICSTTLTSSSGSLICDIPDSFGNSTIVSEIFSNGLLSSSRTYSLQAKNPDDSGSTIILAIMMVITLAMLFVSNVIGILLGALLGLFLAGALLYINTGSLFTVGSVITWAVITAIIILYKIIKNTEK